jgi:ABC-type cobalamin transport system ATPase subunit
MTQAPENPFSADRIEKLTYRFREGSWETILQKLEAASWRGAIVGSNGTGKTTLLEQLSPHIEARGFVPRMIRLRGESTQAEKDVVLAQARGLRAPDFLLLDGAEQLTTRQWLPLRVAIDALAGCVVTVHRTSRLPTIVELTPTPALLDELVAELTGGQLPPGEAGTILARNHGNIRRCFRELHDRFNG